jgi:HSP20 family protein
MNIVRYDPFREIRGLQNEMNRVFGGLVPTGWDNEEGLNAAWNPKVNVFENKDNLVLEAELPGMNRDDFDLSIESNVLTLKGERKFEKKNEGDNYHRIERAYGSFTRSFTLPSTVTSENAKADFNNGVLTITMPKREETKARKIEITGADTGSTPKTIDTQSKSSTASA